jgi:hypothetical protein
MADFGEGSKPSNSSIMDAMREKVGDQKFDPAKPNISVEKMILQPNPSFPILKMHIVP